jgi:hypothetical protein
VGSSWSEAGDVVVDVFAQQLKLKKRGAASRAGDEKTGGDLSGRTLKPAN